MAASNAQDPSATAQPGDVVDWHSHVWLPEHLGSEWGGEIDAKYPHTPSRCGSPESHNQAMQHAGITKCLIVGLRSNHLGLQIPNEYIADAVRNFQGTAIGLASVDPNSSDARDQVIYAATELQLRGLKLSPPYQAFHPHSPEAYRVYDAAAGQGMFFMFHQGAVTHRRGVLEVAQPVLLDRVARDFPDTKIIIAHMGQPWHNEVIPMLRKHPNVYADVSARCTRTTQLAEMLKNARDYGVLPKVLWGSDFPTFDPLRHMQDFLAVASLGDPNGISEQEVADVLYNRPLNLLTS